jgi:replicative DNA helicase
MNYTNEQILLGELIANGNKLNEVRAILPDGTFFEDNECSKYYEAFLETWDVHGELDCVIVSDSLKMRQLSNSKLSEWNDQSYGSNYILPHARLVAEKYMKREGIKVIHKLHTEYTESLEPVDSLESAIESLSNLRSHFVKEHSISLSIVAKETCDAIDKHYAGDSESIKFGFTDIDNITGGMDKGNLIVYAALAKRGKSTMMLQTVFYNALKGIPCLIFSTEMKRTDLMLRYAMIKHKVKWLDYIQKKMSDSEKERLKRYVIELGAKCPIIVSDRVSSILDIISESERVIQNKGTRLIAIDYIQRVVPVNKKSNENREREIATISNGLKNIAFKNNISLIALSQLNDNMQTRESRAIEQEMDKMLTVNAEDKDEKTADGKSVVIGIRLQQRMGASGNFGDVKMIYDKEFGYWKSYIHDDHYGSETDRSSSLF